MSDHKPSIKSQVLGFLKRTQKATAGALGGATALASATFIPAPINGWVAGAVLVLTWLVSYALPWVTSTVESFPDHELSVSEVVAKLQGTDAAPESPADEVVEAAPTEDTPDDSGPATAAMSAEDIQAALNETTTEIPAVQ